MVYWCVFVNADLSGFICVACCGNFDLGELACLRCKFCCMCCYLCWWHCFGMVCILVVVSLARCGFDYAGCEIFVGQVLASG